jgi:hypothetical protein
MITMTRDALDAGTEGGWATFKPGRTLEINLTPGMFSADEVMLLCSGIIKHMEAGVKLVMKKPSVDAQPQA